MRSLLSVGLWENQMSKKQPDPIDKHVGARLRMRRMMLEKSQSWLADAIGLTFQQVQKYEKGTNRMASSRLQQVANILQVPVTFFLTVAGAIEIGWQRPSLAYVSEFLATSDGLALIRAFTQIKSAKLRRNIVNVVEEIVGGDPRPVTDLIPREAARPTGER